MPSRYTLSCTIMNHIRYSSVTYPLVNLNNKNAAKLYDNYYFYFFSIYVIISYNQLCEERQKQGRRSAQPGTTKLKEIFNLPTYKKNFWKVGHTPGNKRTLHTGRISTFHLKMLQFRGYTNFRKRIICIPTYYLFIQITV